MLDFYSKTDIPDIILESIRFTSHIAVIYMLENIVDDKSLIDTRLLRTVMFVIISVIVYNLIIKKLFNSTIKKMREIKEESDKQKK